MIETQFALAFGAGLVATMNPCGFAMLPAYLSYFIGNDDDGSSSRAGAVRRALLVGGVMSSAFLVVFGAAGVLITTGFRSVIDWIPWLALAVGVGVVLLGVAMVAGFEPKLGLPAARRAGSGRDLRAVFAFGVSYALASLSCTLPVFLSVVAGQVTSTNFLSGVLTFVVYGAGMGLVLTSITLATALGKRSLVAALRSWGRHLNRAAGAILVAAGVYIVWFWATNLGRGAGALSDSGAFRFVESLSQRALDLFAGNPSAWALVLGGIVTAAILYVVLRPEDDPPEDNGGEGEAGGPDGQPITIGARD